MYKIETHLHTNVISCCANMSPKELVEQYHAAGYAALTVTDHYNLDNFRAMGIDYHGDDALQRFLEGYRQVKAAAEPLGMQVYYGAEVRFTENMNDYLVYGFSDGLLCDPTKICTMSIVDFIACARRDDALVVQAHPFRAPSVPVAPELIDGVEVANRHPYHKNRNELAAEYAYRYAHAALGGSDFHGTGCACIGGIRGQWLPKDNRDLVGLIRSYSYTVL